MKLATTTADVRGYADSPAGDVRLFADTGFRCLDLDLYKIIYPGSPYLAPGDGWKAVVAEAGEAAARLGFTFCQAHAPDGEHFIPGEARDALLLATRRSIEACALLGIPRIVVHAAGSPTFTPTEFLHRNRDFYALFFEDMDRHAVHVLTENSCEQNAPYCYLRTGREMREFVDFVGHPRLGICWDTGHAHMRAGMDQYQCILDMGDRLGGLHVQDNYGGHDSHSAPFFGNCNFDPILQGLVDIGYQGYFTFEGNSMLRSHADWPHFRKPWEYKGQPVGRLLDPPVHIKQQAIALMYQIGRYMLEQYGVFEP